jgi:hypothetical protein
MIDRVAKAQKAADDARLKALQEYAAALGRIGTGGGAVGGVTGTTPGSVGGAPGSPSGAPATIADVKAKEAADAIKYFADTVTDTFQTVEDSGAFNALVKSFMGGAINSFNAGEFRANEGGAYGGLSRGGAFDRDTNVTINVNTGIGDPEAIARAIEDTLNQSSYRGTSVNRGSGDYLVA